MNFQAAVKGIAPAGGIRPASHITASFVSATKAKPAAHYFGRVPKAADITSVRLGSARCGIAQPCLTLSANASAFLHAQHGPESTGFAHGTPWECGAILSGQRSNTDERHIGRQRFGLGPRTVGATSRSGGCWTGLRVMRNSGCRFVPRLFLGLRPRNLGNPCAEKVSAHRPRQNKGAASLTKAHVAFRKIGEAVMASEPDACAGVGSPPAGNANHHRLQCASGH